MGSKYASFAELARYELPGRDYRVVCCEPARSQVLIAAPHGGLIELGTSEVARLIAGREHSLFIFEGLKAHGANRDLHITSHQFDHPQCLAMAAHCETVVGIHGCSGERIIHIGGLDEELRQCVGRHLGEAGFTVEPDSKRYPGRHPRNICNLGRRAKGVQIEISYDLRTGGSAPAIAEAVRAAIAAA